jgi:O-antigen/teichoic acid export membrane protein
MSARTSHLNGAYPTPDSVSSRYAVTLGAQLLRLLLSLISAVIVPRTLGPGMYGNYSFLLSTASTLRGFFDPSAQQTFFTFSSRERTSGSLSKLYALVLAGQLVIVFALISAAVVGEKTAWLWPGQQVDQIYWVTLLDWTVFLALSLQQLGDSKGLTVYAQLIGAAVSLFAVIGLLALWGAGRLNFYSYVWLNLTAAALMCVLLGYWLLVINRDLCWSGALRIGDYVKRWWVYARPLILLEYYLPVVSFLGLYFIQRWYGSVEQGYYALALQWSALAMVFTNAAVSIFWRELARQSAARDYRLAANTYLQFSRLLFFLVLVLSCWLSMSSDLLVQVIAGEAYLAGSNVLAIMAFYPVAQTLGQLTVAALKATERTASYARWSVLLSVPDLFLTYFLLAPNDGPVPGLHLGAVGMAIKTAVYGLVSVQIYDWLNCRFLRLSYATALGRRAVAIGIVGVLAFALLRWGGASLQSARLHDVTALAVSSVAYAVAIGAIVWCWPDLAGLSRAQILRGVRLPSRR